MSYSINFRRLIRGLLPFALRRPMGGILVGLSSPFVHLHARLLDYRLAIEGKLSYNAQYPNLQRLLNDMFDSEQRRILVYDSPQNVKPVVIHPSGAFGKRMQTTVLRIKSWETWGYRPFVVEVPAALRSDETVARISRTVEKYKFSGTKFIIQNS